MGDGQQGLGRRSQRQLAPEVLEPLLVVSQLQPELRTPRRQPVPFDVARRRGEQADARRKQPQPLLVEPRIARPIKKRIA